jgi:hypothetical protein
MQNKSNKFPSISKILQSFLSSSSLFSFFSPVTLLLARSKGIAALLPSRTRSIVKMHVLSLLTAAIAAVPLASAIHFLEPEADANLQKGQSYPVRWGFVDTDPATLSLYLVNFVDWPPFYTQLAADLPTTAGEFNVTIPCDVNASWGYQMYGSTPDVVRSRVKETRLTRRHSNAINGTNVYVIYAQTSRFRVLGADCSGPLASALSDAGCQPLTITQTVTATVSAATLSASEAAR